MKYELALELKKAGFPQKRGCSSCLQGYAFDFKVVPHEEAFGDDYVSCPTLSELIKACVTNKEENCIYRLDYDWFERQWEASAGTADQHFACFGSTPEESVAKLWLELNKK